MNLASALCVSSHSHSNINLTFFILGKKYMQAVTPTHIFCSNLLYYFAPSHQLLNPSLDVFFFFLSKYYMYTTMFFLMIKITNSDQWMKKEGCVYFLISPYQIEKDTVEYEICCILVCFHFVFLKSLSTLQIKLVWSLKLNLITSID